jgi:hypothetical protein
MQGDKENLKGKNAEYNAAKIIDIFKGSYNEFSQSVALNTAAGLIVSGQENDFKNAFNKATKHLSSGKVFEAFDKITIKIMANVLDKIIEDKKESLKLIKKTNSLDSIENTIKSLNNFLNFKEVIANNKEYR